MQQNYDVLIVGGGLSGNCLALALNQHGLRVAVLEANSQAEIAASPAGDRALALASGSTVMLEALGIWQGIKEQSTAIKHIHVSDRGHFGKTRLSAEKNQVDALGYVIVARTLEQHLDGLVAQAGIQRFFSAQVKNLSQDALDITASIVSPEASFTLSASLLVGADGGLSHIRQLLGISQHIKNYAQTALVTTVTTSLPHQNVAYERFTAAGPLALLPIGRQQCAVVWARSHGQAQALLDASDDAFIEELQYCFGYRLGELKLAAPKRAFPLSLIRAGQLVAQRAVIIGNAAHQLHPVAGQGFNLGLRDVAQLAEKLITQYKGRQDLGAADMLRAYAQGRQKDYQQVIGFTDQLVRIFSNDGLALAAARNIGLTVLDHLPFAKSLLAQQAMGLFEHLNGLKR
ncbi:MAG: 2-octaprenyl-6-methoxyphenyl hydroxylase [Methylococcaceae bacterium]|jgi:2-octaprenyl-6-methoxyphenol hydroxylase